MLWGALDLDHELVAADLAAVVRIDDLRRSPARCGLGQGFHAEVRLHDDRYPLLQYPSAPLWG